MDHHANRQDGTGDPACGRMTTVVGRMTTSDDRPDSHVSSCHRQDLRSRPDSHVSSCQRQDLRSRPDDLPYLSLTAIAAVSANSVIGNGEGMLWNLPEDFARFKRITMGGLLVMGRRTYESLGGALPGRTSVVLTHNINWTPTKTRGRDVLVASSVTEIGAILAHHSDQRWWSIGGGEIYRALWEYTTDLDITEVKQTYDGTVTFPHVGSEWKQTSREPHEEFDFVTYERVGSEAQKALGALIGYEG